MDLGILHLFNSATESGIRTSGTQPMEGDSSHESVLNPVQWLFW